MCVICGWWFSKTESCSTGRIWRKLNDDGETLSAKCEVPLQAASKGWEGHSGQREGGGYRLFVVQQFVVVVVDLERNVRICFKAV